MHATANGHDLREASISKLGECLQAELSAVETYDLAVANQRKSSVQVADAERQLKRQQTLKDQQLVAGATVETAEVSRDTALASLSASKAQVQQAAANLKQASSEKRMGRVLSRTSSADHGVAEMWSFQPLLGISDRSLST